MLAVEAGNDVVLWARRAALAEQMNTEHVNPDYQPGVQLPESLRATDDPLGALRGAEAVVIAVPAQTLRSNLGQWRELVPLDAVVVSLMKGVELGTLDRMSQVIGEVLGVPDERIAVVSGPNLAREIARHQPAATVVACVDESVAVKLQAALQTRYFRPYTNTDVVGVELGGAVKNVIALATGIADGLDLGHNAQAAIITRGLAEMTRLGLAMGAEPLTFMGLAGLGDLVATCMSPLSRNRTFGVNLAKGFGVDEAAALTRQTAEGVKSSTAILELGRRHAVDLPITEHVSSVLYDGTEISEMVASLMSRVAKPEW
jgi:glycerol-3-phosphate dehydrogenase (NAD(P)+)